jgi:hypothetical protein
MEATGSFGLDRRTAARRLSSATPKPPPAEEEKARKKLRARGNAMVNVGTLFGLIAKLKAEIAQERAEILEKIEDIKLEMAELKPLLDRAKMNEFAAQWLDDDANGQLPTEDKR